MNEVIRQRRSELGMSQADLATKEGLLITDLTRDDWHVIDAFEDDRYDLHQLQLADGRYAWAYVYSASLAAPADLWDSQHFTERHLAEYVRRCIAWRQ